MELENTKDAEGDFLKVLIYGESGSGKTTLAGTLIGKTLIISAEAGLLSLRGKDIDVVNLNRRVGKTGPEPIVDPGDRLNKLRDTFAELAKGTKYQNVFLDSLTEIGELVVAQLNKEFPDRKDSMVLWGENFKRMRSIVKSFRDLPVNVYMTCLSTKDKDESNKRYLGFSVAGKLADLLPQYFDEVFYLHVDDEGKRGLVTRKTDQLICKDRSGRLEPMEQSDLGYIAGKIVVPENPKAAKEGEKR